MHYVCERELKNDDSFSFGAPNEKGLIMAHSFITSPVAARTRAFERSLVFYLLTIFPKFLL